MEWFILHFKNNPQNLALDLRQISAIDLYQIRFLFRFLFVFLVR